jgi:hypothetical protein
MVPFPVSYLYDDNDDFLWGGNFSTKIILLTKIEMMMVWLPNI